MFLTSIESSRRPISDDERLAQLVANIQKILKDSDLLFQKPELIFELLTFFFDFMTKDPRQNSFHLEPIYFDITSTSSSTEAALQRSHFTDKDVAIGRRMRMSEDAFVNQDTLRILKREPKFIVDTIVLRLLQSVLRLQHHETREIDTLAFHSETLSIRREPKINNVRFFYQYADEEVIQDTTLPDEAQKLLNDVLYAIPEHIQSLDLS